MSEVDESGSFAARLTRDPHFQSEDRPVQKFLPPEVVYAFVASAGALTVLKFTKEALDVVDKVIDIVKKALGKEPAKMEVICPDGKTRSVIEGSEKQVVEMMTEFLKQCGRN